MVTMQTDTEDDIDIIDVKLDKYDIDHLRDGDVARKPVGEDTLLHIRYVGWADE